MTLTSPRPQGTPFRSHQIAKAAEVVRLARRRRRMTQQEVADLVGVGVRSMNELENRRRTHLSLATFLRTLDVLGIYLDYRIRD